MSAGSTHDQVAVAAEALVVHDQLNGAQLPSRRLAITYDDGPGRNTMAIAEYLQDQGVPATFFVNGCRFDGSPTPIAQGHQACKPPDQTIDARFSPDVLEDLIDLGHRVANHTMDHVHLANASAATIRSQVLGVQDLLKGAVRDQLFLLRPPHNGWDDDADTNDIIVANVNAIAPELIGPFKFDIVPFIGTISNVQHDYACLDSTTYTPAQCAQAVLNGIGTGSNQRDHGIIQLHDRESDSELAGAAAGTTETLELTVALVDALRSQGYVFVPLDAIPGVLGPKRFNYPVLFTSQYSDSKNWAASPSYYQSIHLGDLDDDGDADICGRGTGGLWCAVSNGGAFVSEKFWLTSDFKDADGWLAEKYGTTIQLGDIDGDGDADVCGRGASSLWCAKSRGKEGVQAFTGTTRWSTGSDFSDADGWGASASYYGSIKLADVNGDGKADACGRRDTGIWCALSNGVDKFGPMTRWLAGFTDLQNWSPLQYGTTIMFGNINSDDRADVCGRDAGGIRCALANSSGTGFLQTTLWIVDRFSDRDGWNTSSGKFGSLRLADVNGDGRDDVCGRNDTGIVCAFSAGYKFTDYLHLRNDKYNDLDGWGPARYGTTIQLADVNNYAGGQVEMCGRGISGIWCSTASLELLGP